MGNLELPILPSRLYRFRSLTRSKDAVDQEIDSIRERYLYCPEFSRMNDPMEGIFETSALLRRREDYDNILEEMTTRKTDLGLACFSESYTNPLMWAHYAGNYSGICIGYNAQKLLEGLPVAASLVRVAYVDEPPRVRKHQANNTENAVRRVLSQKQYNWAYEREWRVMASKGRVRVGNDQPITAIFFGARVDMAHRQRILSKIQATNIEAYMMEVYGYDHAFVPINTAARARANATPPKKPTVAAKRSAKKTLNKTPDRSTADGTRSITP